ncbi:ribosomal maturation YjgA family protein [Aestuariivivens insulae]|uniref:ribosomal maturation YjgA family protein n=1 Tax=Aestuariivivens insulae TaxID=1621988 RepID=UPI001F5AB7E4|nr:DUF2809 domain-containing protein [Aestuariivivens insulae]
MKLYFNLTYFSFFILLLCIEALIAIFLKTGFIRHTIGDFLVVILIYCFVKSFFKITPLKLGIAVLAFAFLIEFLQLVNILALFNLHKKSFLKLLLGSTFQITDLIAYTLGVASILSIELNIYKSWNT